MNTDQVRSTGAGLVESSLHSFQLQRSLYVSTLVLVLVAMLAFANGANDNCKGVATLVGYGAARPWTALCWATVTTALGAAAGTRIGSGLLAAFRADFIGTDQSLATGFFAAVLLGAFAWVLFAAMTGLPVSTTHAILGGLLGAGIVEVGLSQIGWATVAQRFALPLLISPVIALVLVFLVGRSFAALSSGNRNQQVGIPATPEHEAALAMHWGTSGLVGFARGWNDTPKIAALGIAALPASAASISTTTVVAAAMAMGGLLAGRRVLNTLATKITPLPLGESLASSGVSAILVALASWRGLPVSTTHVTTGGIVGAGMSRSSRGVHWRVVGDVALSWVVTLPAAALLAALVRSVLSAAG